MSKFLKITTITISFVLLCSCARQRYINQNEFAKLFNKNSQNTKLDESGYYLKDNVFCFFAESENIREVMITLEQNERFNVICAELTVIKQEKELEESEKNELFKITASILSVICNCEEERALTELKKADFTAEKFDFINHDEQLTLLNADCFLCTNEEIISFSLKIK